MLIILAQALFSESVAQTKYIRPRLSFRLLFSQQSIVVPPLLALSSVCARPMPLLFEWKIQTLVPQGFMEPSSSILSSTVPS